MGNEFNVTRVKPQLDLVFKGQAENLAQKDQERSGRSNSEMTAVQLVAVVKKLTISRKNSVGQ